MKKFLYGLGLSVVFALAAAPFMPGTATATSATPTPSASASFAPTFDSCANLKGWYVNGDEESRKPTPTVDGLKFEGNDLIHHAADLALKDLKPGSYDATPAPDQPSFFSVEVRASTGAYGTLRWNKNAAMWQIVIGAGTGPGGPATDGPFSGADPVALLEGKVTKWGAFDATTKVISFGVGYTNSPPGTVATTISKVIFNDKSYNLTCAPPQPSASASSSAKPSTSGPYYATCADAPGQLVKGVDAGYRPELDGDNDGVACDEKASLPLTGMSGRTLAGIAGAGVLLVGLGGLVLIATRKKKGHFHS